MKINPTTTLDELFSSLESKDIAPSPIIKYCQTLLQSYGIREVSDLLNLNGTPHDYLTELHSHIGIPAIVCNALVEELGFEPVQPIFPTNHISMLQIMHSHVLCCIFRYLPFGETLVIETQVCRKWRHAVSILKPQFAKVSVVLDDMFKSSLQSRNQPLLRLNLGLLRLIMIELFSQFGHNTSLVNNVSLSDEAVLSAITVFKTLRILRVSQCSFRTYTLHSIIMQTKQLEELDLSYCKNVNDQVLRCIGVRGHRLQYINLSGCRNITDDGIHFITSSCTNIKTFLLFDCLIGDRSLQSIAFNLPHLQQVGVTSTHVTRSGIQTILNQCLYLDPQYKDMLIKFQRLLPPSRGSLPQHIQDIGIVP